MPTHKVNYIDGLEHNRVHKNYSNREKVSAESIGERKVIIISILFTAGKQHVKKTKIQVA